MGALLGHTTPDTELSDSTLATTASAAGTGATIGSLIWPGPGTAIGAGVGAVAGFVTSVWGSGAKCSAKDKKKRKQFTQVIEQNLTVQDRLELTAMAHTDILPTPQAMANFFMGGHDCLHKNIHPDDQRFIDQLPWVIEKRVRERQEKLATASQKENKLTANMDTSKANEFKINPAMLTAAGVSIVAVSAVGLVMFRKSKPKKQ